MPQAVENGKNLGSQTAMITGECIPSARVGHIGRNDGIEEADQTKELVLQLIESSTLADKIVLQQIAEGLDTVR